MPILAGPQVLEKTSPNVKGLLLSAGARGCSYIFRTKDGGTFKGYVPVFKIKVQDTTGARDAFLGGFLEAMVKVWPRVKARDLSGTLGTLCLCWR